MTRLLMAGTGLIGHRHLAHIEAHPDLEAVGIIDPDAERRAHPSIPGFACIEDVDVPANGIVIATPTETHLPLSRAAAARGWHLLVEKPIAESLDAADAMIKLAEDAGVALLIGHHRRHHPRVEKLKMLMDEGVIGTPVSAQLLWLMRKPDDYFDVGWRQGMNGAPIKNNLIHDMDMLHGLFGPVDEVLGLGSNAIRNAERTESGAALLQFSSGVILTINFADTTPTPWGFEAGTGESPAIPHTAQDSLRIAGTKGGIEFPSLTVWGEAETWNDRPEARTIDVPEGVPLVRQLEHFADVIAGRARPRVTGEDARLALETILRIEAATLPKGLA